MLALLSLAGCAEDGTSPEKEHNHAAHVVPAHKPKNFPAAVCHLRALNDQLARNATATSSAPLTDDQALAMALDIAAWLPETAGDSDMPEAAWLAVNAQSAPLVASYQTLLQTSDPAKARASLQQAGSSIAALEALLGLADARWFDKVPETRLTNTP